MAECLRSPVKLRFAERIAANHGKHFSGVRVKRYQTALNIGNLTEIIRIFGQIFGSNRCRRNFFHQNDIPFGQDIRNLLRRIADTLIFQVFTRPAENIQRDDAAVAVGSFNFRLVYRNGKDDGFAPAVIFTGGQLYLSQTFFIVGIQRNVGKRSAPAVAAVIVFYLFAKGFGRNLLQFWVKRGTNQQPAFIQGIFAKFVFDLAADFFAEIFGIIDKLPAPLNGHQRFKLGGFGVINGNVSLFGHTVKHPIATGNCRIIMAGRIIIVGSFGQCGQICDFFQRQFIKRLAKIIQCCGGNAI